MILTGDPYDLNHFRDGISITKLLKDCSVSYIDKLRKNGLIYMDEHKVVHLTEKGHVALQMGVDHYLRLEEAESVAMKTNLKQIRTQNNYLMALLIILLFFFVFGVISIFI